MTSIHALKHERYDAKGARGHIGPYVEPYFGPYFPFAGCPLWSWFAGSFHCKNAQGFECDSMQSVPREMTYDASLETLIINHIAEISQLRSGLLARV